MTSRNVVRHFQLPERSLKLVAGAVFAALALVLSACSSAEPESPNDSPAPTSQPETPSEAIADIAQDLDAPWSIAFYEDTPLVSERDSGRVLELQPRDDGTYEPRELGTIDEVSAGGEGGLLGLAVKDQYLYAYFTSSNDNRIERFELRGDVGSLSLGRAESILKGIPKAGNHNGGRIAFGPDEKLYVTTGDAGDRSTSQNRASLAGKILRLEPDGSIPSDNPFNDSPVFSYGHRNPQGIAWDDEGTLYASEFGQNTWDELNVIKAGSNYGWPTVEGIAENRDFEDPVQQWEPSKASPSGVAIIGGSIFIANLRGARLREVPLDDLSNSTEHFVNDYGRIRDAVRAPDDSLWILTNNTDGRGDPSENDDRIIRIDPAQLTE